jgi:hypothetical protein
MARDTPRLAFVISIANQEHSPERQRETLTGVERGEQIRAVVVSANGNLTSATYMTVGNRKKQSQVLGIDNQAGANDISIGSVAARASARFDLKHNSVALVEGIYFVQHLRPSVAAEENRTPDALGRLLAGLHIKPELAKASSQLLKNPIAS